MSCNKETLIQNVNIPGNEILVKDTTSNGNNGSGSDTTILYTVKFRAGTDTYVTKATGLSALQQNRYVEVYCYYNMDDFKDSVLYNTVRAGVLSPVSGNQLQVPPASYEFYAIGIANRVLTPPSFTNLEYGMSSNNLQNGIDYIGGYIVDQEVAQDMDLTLTMSHACAQIIVEVGSASESITVDSLSGVTITPPSTANSKFVLFTGLITPATTLSNSTPLAMNVNGTVCNQIVLPLSYSGDLTFTFTAYINGSTTGRQYSANIPLVNNKLASGSSYKYSIEIGESTVTFGNVVVTNWVEVDETGTPISPTLI